jgi:hypothetical protein
MTVRFLKETAERALKTFAQVLGTALVAGATTDIVSMPWLSAFYLAAGGAALSIIMSVASAPFGAKDTPSLVRPEE